MVFLGQKTYGTKPEDLAARDEYFEMMLQGYTFDQVQQAFHQYAKTKDDLPAPANIIQLIENPPVVTYDDVPCSCLKHYGIGNLTAEKRAQTYAWYRDKFPQGFSREKQEWLAGYQREHGHQESNI